MKGHSRAKICRLGTKNLPVAAKMHLWAVLRENGSWAVCADAMMGGKNAKRYLFFGEKVHFFPL